jgi:hypothetical protein
VDHRRVITGHPHETTEWDQTNRVRRLPELETGKHPTEAESELKHSHTEVLRDEKVAELVHEDEDAED